MSTRLFPLGQVVITIGAAEALQAALIDPLSLVDRHVAGDWGALCKQDILSNDNAVDKELRIFSAYPISHKAKVWVITEVDRSSTTILLPEEY